MRHLRNCPAHRVVDDSLSRSVGQMIVTTDDVRDTHVVIVDDNGVHVGRRTIGTQDDEIIEIFIRETNVTLHGILYDGFSVLWRLDSNNRFYASRRFRWIAITPTAIIAWWAALCACLFAHRFQFFSCGIAVIGLTKSHQLFSDFTMTRRALELGNCLAVPVKAKPGQTIENGGGSCFSGALPIRVFDAQQHLAAVMLRIKPVEQSSARPTNMKITRGRGAKRVMTGFDMMAPLCHAPFESGGRCRGWAQT